MVQKKLPVLPHGQGSMNYINGGIDIRYRKNIKLEDGSIIRISVTAKTAYDCMKLMAEKEQETKRGYIPNYKQTLYDAMLEWVEVSKKNQLKPQAYRTLKNTINNQIGKSILGTLRYQQIRADELRLFLAELNEKEYSPSTIKKTYNALGNFYRIKSFEEGFKNPMQGVEMIKVSNIKKQTKEVQFFEEDDIKKFICVASSTWKTGTPRYRYGNVLAANIFLGLRGGELLALQWKDIDWDKRTICVSKTLVIEDENDKNSERTTKTVIQQETKTSKIRYVPINSNAYDLLLKHYTTTMFNSLEDYVITTRNGKTSCLMDLSDTIKCIEDVAGTRVKYAGTHILRHTCASLYFRHGAPIEVICNILGNSREVCEKVYVHLIDEQKEKVASMINLDTYVRDLTLVG